MTIEPDTKDWTWVLERPCPECGFDGRAIVFDDVAPMVRANAATWVEVLARADVAERARPDRWSALEYACHVRDVFRVYDERLALMRAEDDPLFPNWDQDATAVSDAYGEADPAVVADELVAAAERLAAAFATVTPDERVRPGRRSDGAAFTIDTFARYFIHDPVHHLVDVVPRKA